MVWNDEKIKNLYDRIIKEAKAKNICENVIQNPYLDQISATREIKSKKELMENAYYAGMFRALLRLNESMDIISFQDIK